MEISTKLLITTFQILEGKLLIDILSFFLNLI